MALQLQLKDWLQLKEFKAPADSIVKSALTVAI